MSERVASSEEIGKAAGAIATATIGVAVERVLISLAYGVGLVYIPLMLSVWIWSGKFDGSTWWMPATSAVLLMTAQIHRLLRRKASTHGGSSHAR